MTESVSFNEPEGLLDDYQHLESEEANSLKEYTDFLRSQYRKLDRDVVKYWASNGDDEQLEHTMARRNQVIQVLNELYKRGYIGSVMKRQHPSTSVL